jgi:hypothetical protein
VVRILGRDTAQRAIVQLGHVNAQCDEWRRQNPGAVMAVPRLRLRRSPRRGHVGPRQSRPGARRTTASRDGPEDGESDPPGVGATGGVGTSRVFAASLREGATT